jgi:hypothetical protein
VIKKTPAGLNQVASKDTKRYTRTHGREHRS